MPRALDPNSRFPVTLASDADKPEAERPVFLARYLSGRDWERVSELAEGEPVSVKQMLDPVYEGLAIGIAGWRNMVDGSGTSLDYSPDLLRSVLDPGEARELLMAVLAGSAMGASVPKDCGSRSPSSAANCAASASVAGA